MSYQDSQMHGKVGKLPNLMLDSLFATIFVVAAPHTNPR
jgi:hypothetical protein